MLQGAAAQAAEPENHRFPCPACGADLRFDPKSGGLKCRHCGHEEPIPARRGGIRELDLRAVEQNTLPPAELQEVRFATCPSCGAQVELGLDEHARECPSCASPIVTDTGAFRQIKPQAQLPFLLRITTVSAHTGHHHAAAGPDAIAGTAVTLLHMAGYLVVTALVAVVVYERLGLHLLRKLWFNLDLVWAVALIATAAWTAWG